MFKTNIAFAEPLQVVQLASRYSPPYSWYDQKTKHYRGFIFHFQQKLFEEVNLEMNVNQINYNDKNDRQRLIEKLQHGEVDLIVGSDRASQFESSVIWVKEPLVELQISLFVKKGKKFEFINWESLQGKVGAIVSQQGRKSFYTKLSPLNFAQRGLKIETALNQQEAIDWLLQERVDYWATDHFIGNGLITAFGLSDQLDAIDRTLVTVPLFIGVSKKSSHLDKIAKIEQGIIKMRESGQLDYIRSRFMRDFINSQM